MEYQSALTAKQTKFVAEYLVDGNGARAAIAAGYGAAGSRVRAHRLTRDNAAVRAEIARLQALDTERLELDRAVVISGILAGIELAKEQGNPAAMIAGWREIGRMMGFYEPQRHQVEVSAEVRVDPRSADEWLLRPGAGRSGASYASCQPQPPMDQTPSPNRPEGGFACVAAAWQAHEGELLGYLRQQLPDGHAAEDLLQDVFVKAMRQGEGFCSLDNPRAWLFQVARNAVIDRARVSKVQVPIDEVGQEIEAPVPEALAPVDALAGCVARVLGELPPDDAAILRACDLDGQTQREFAEQQGLSLPAAKSRLLRARQRMRDQLSTACQVRFDDDGSVSGHVPRPPAAD